MQGNYGFACMITSGHTIGHSCLYEPGRNILITGDQITAGIQFLLERANPLADHLQSLVRLREMDVTLVLPGHGSPFRDHRKRIDALCTHLKGRCEAAYTVLGEGGKDAWEVTLALDGLISDRDPLDTLPLIRKFIHTRHAFAYLQHLAPQERVKKEHCHGRMFFPVPTHKIESR